MKDEPFDSYYNADSYQKLFDEIKEELKCPISFAQIKDPICLCSGQTIDKSSYNLLIRNYLNNPYTNQLIEKKNS